MELLSTEQGVSDEGLGDLLLLALTNDYTQASAEGHGDAVGLARVVRGGAGGRAAEVVTPLQLCAAVGQGDPALVSLLLSHVPPARARQLLEEEEEVVLEAAAASRAPDVMRLLMSYYPSAAERRRALDNCVLNSAASVGDVEMMRLILSAHGDDQRRRQLLLGGDAKGRSVLMSAKYARSVQELVWSYVTDPAERLQALMHQDADGRSFLHTQPDHDGVQAYLEAFLGNDEQRRKAILAQTPGAKLTPLMLSSNYSSETVQLLLSYLPEEQRVAAIRQRDALHHFSAIFDATCPAVRRVLLQYLSEAQRCEVMSERGDASWCGATPLLYALKYERNVAKVIDHLRLARECFPDGGVAWLQMVACTDPDRDTVLGVAVRLDSGAAVDIILSDLEPDEALQLVLAPQRNAPSALALAASLGCSHALHPMLTHVGERHDDLTTALHDDLTTALHDDLTTALHDDLTTALHAIESTQLTQGHKQCCRLLFGRGASLGAMPNAAQRERLEAVLRDSVNVAMAPDTLARVVNEASVALAGLPRGRAARKRAAEQPQHARRRRVP